MSKQSPAARASSATTPSPRFISDRFNVLKDHALAITELMQLAGEGNQQISEVGLLRTGVLLESIVNDMKAFVDEVAQSRA